MHRRGIVSLLNVKTETRMRRRLCSHGFITQHCIVARSKVRSDKIMNDGATVPDIKSLASIQYSVVLSHSRKITYLCWKSNKFVKVQTSSMNPCTATPRASLVTATRRESSTEKLLSTPHRRSSTSFVAYSPFELINLRPWVPQLNKSLYSLEFRYLTQSESPR
jgi:hypothetical protein